MNYIKNLLVILLVILGNQVCTAQLSHLHLGKPSAIELSYGMNKPLNNIGDAYSNQLLTDVVNGWNHRDVLSQDSFPLLTEMPFGSNRFNTGFQATVRYEWGAKSGITDVANWVLGFSISKGAYKVIEQDTTSILNHLAVNVTLAYQWNPFDDALIDRLSIIISPGIQLGYDGTYATKLSDTNYENHLREQFDQFGLNSASDDELNATDKYLKSIQDSRSTKRLNTGFGAGIFLGARVNFELVERASIFANARYLYDALEPFQRRSNSLFSMNLGLRYQI